MTRKLWRLKELPEMTGLSRSMIDKLLRLGLLRTVMVGRARLVPNDELERLVRDGVPDVRSREPVAQAS